MLLKKLLAKYRLFYFVIFLSSFAYNQEYFSKQLTTKDGLPDNNVYSILKDKDGKLWIGTDNGIVVKGAKLSTYYTKKDGLPHNSCWQIKEDKLGQIWIGTFGGGLAIFKNGKFQNFKTKDGISSNKIRKLFLYKDDLYIGTSNGINKINIHSKKITNFNVTNKKTSVVNEKKDITVLGINEINGKIIFNTHSHGVYIINGNNAEVLNKELYTTFCLFKDKNILYISKNGFANGGKAIYKVNANDFVSYRNAKLKSIGYNNSIFWDLIKTNNGKIIGAAHGVEFNTGGLYEIDEKENKINLINKEYGIKTNNIWDLFYDENEDLLYVGTLGEGVYILNFQRNVLFQKNENNIDYKINSFFENVVLENEKLIITTKSKNYIFRKKQLFVLVRDKVKKLSAKSKRLCDASAGNFPYNGFVLKSVNLVNNKVILLTNYGIIEFLLSKNIIQKNIIILSAESYLLLRNNSILFAFPYSGLIYIENTQNPEKYRKYETLNKNDYPKDIIEIFKTRKNNYIITREGDLYSLQGISFSNLKFKLIQQKKEFQQITNISNSRVAISTRDGEIYLLNDENKTISIKKEIQHWEINGKKILKLLYYKDNLVILTEKGINLYKLKKRNNVLLDNEIGIEYKTLHSASIFNNQLNLVTEKGLYKVDLSKWINNSNKKKIFISKFIVNGKVRLLRNKTLKHNENNITIVFDTNFSSMPNKLFYRYHLEGLDSSFWSKWNQQNYYNFSYLPSGNYNLRVQVKDTSTGEEKKANLISFKIETPFWKKTFFIVLFIIFIMFLIYTYIKYTLNKIKIREQKISSYEKRIIETKLEALQSQMNPHFIFNSLNVIQNHIINNDIISSLNYMNNFSKLMRKTLEHSSKTFISIIEEIEFIELYINTQNIRFNNCVKFEYEIDNFIDKEEELIPPMIIQPLIENSFIHAFSEKITSPKILLKIEKNNDRIFISLIDNGIGIKNDGNLKKSKGLKLLKERIMLLDKNNQLIVENLEIGSKMIIILN